MLHRLDKNSKEVAGDEMDMEMIPGSITMRIKDPEREGECHNLEWERVEVSPLLTYTKRMSD